MEIVSNQYYKYGYKVLSYRYTINERKFLNVSIEINKVIKNEWQCQTFLFDVTSFNIGNLLQTVGGWAKGVTDDSLAYLFCSLVNFFLSVSKNGLLGVLLTTPTTKIHICDSSHPTQNSHLCPITSYTKFTYMSHHILHKIHICVPSHPTPKFTYVTHHILHKSPRVRASSKRLQQAVDVAGGYIEQNVDIYFWFL